ncbi:MAG: hypothetical protein ACK4S7_12320 [Sphingorhabdus sp.]
MFDFNTSTPLFGPQVSGSGVFTTSDTPTEVAGETAFSILSITGMVNGSPIVAPFTGTTYGNFFTTGDGFLDGTGTMFLTASGLDGRFFQQSSNGQFRVNTSGQLGSSNFVNASASQIAAAVPTTWMLMLIGMAGVGFSMRRKKHTTMQVRYA